MSWQVTGTQKFPAVIGEPFGGGFFAGYISHTADGNPTHALIVAPRATGAIGTGYTLTTALAWALNQNAANGTNYSTTTIGTVTDGTFNGAANMAVFESIGIANFPAAEFCKNLSIGGFADWYLPSRFELDIAYFNLKPTVDNNVINFGVNDYSVPKRAANYTLTYPAQTYVTAFNTSAEQFVAAAHASSTEISSNAYNGLNFTTGNITNTAKTTALRTRAFRRIAL
jgi:hypothetical protein